MAFRVSHREWHRTKRARQLHGQSPTVEAVAAEVLTPRALISIQRFLCLVSSPQEALMDRLDIILASTSRPLLRRTLLAWSWRAMATLLDRILASVVKAAPLFIQPVSRVATAATHQIKVMARVQVAAVLAVLMVQAATAATQHLLLEGLAEPLMAGLLQVAQQEKTAAAGKSGICRMVAAQVAVGSPAAFLFKDSLVWAVSMVVAVEVLRVAQTNLALAATLSSLSPGHRYLLFRERSS